MAPTIDIPEEDLERTEVILKRYNINYKIRSSVKEIKEGLESKLLQQGVPQKEAKENDSPNPNNKDISNIIDANVFYLSTPNSNGSFNVSSSHPSYHEGASIYRFTKTANNKAIFQIDERELSIKLALQYLDRNIDPICDAQNIFNPNVIGIKTIEKGIAYKDDKLWKVTQKSKIKYITE